MVAALASEYALFPPGFPTLIDRLKRGSSHIERVQFRGHDAWRVDSRSLRREQRLLATEKFSRPTIPGAIQLLGTAAVVLERKLVVRRTRDGSEAYQWRNRYWREELCMLRTALVYWLLHHAECQAHFAFLDADTCFMGQSLSDDELDIAFPHEAGYPVLSLTLHNTVVTAATPAIDQRWEGAVVVKQVNNHRVPVDREVKAQDLCQQMWPYLPQDPDCPTNYTYLSTAAYPDAQHLVTNSTGKRNAPEWLQAQRSVELTDEDEDSTPGESASDVDEKKPPSKRRRYWKGKNRPATAKVGGKKKGATTAGAEEGSGDPPRRKPKPEKKKAKPAPPRNVGPPPPTSLF